MNNDKQKQKEAKGKDKKKKRKKEFQKRVVVGDEGNRRGGWTNEIKGEGEFGQEKAREEMQQKKEVKKNVGEVVKR